ncbi:type II toxin-antitoxin system RelE/ParE family toxin [Serratia proteamaculans]|uniref:Type II toxin-antitoxin system RelE/ParE family toxin n=2 Tax=Serratia proteamaculans TaxID=28151 RepID=A0A7U0N7R0_SERPR|nr:type II toxin-antitoxin system RelE/ParE family toxin [Serratia proteamaculans]MBO1500959.1 type II toxin-antitoxin system RelE/ParE family toxin [Serratia proteamaculans]MDW5509982.1 type II toxin-antitoxin system RelE/ParE family toxin [Serratia proteamaculans]QQX53992.1 type II toxin-antitoxin system RelE/ParE family toxin [Serratia proteamaculans]
MRRKITIRPKTLADMEDIYLYGLARHGLTAAEDYLNHIHDTFDNLSHHQIGRRIESITDDLCALPVGKHIIYFRDDARQVRIIRILHHSRDPFRQQFIG